jgi:hypothetical protein
LNKNSYTKSQGAWACEVYDGESVLIHSYHHPATELLIFLALGCELDDRGPRVRFPAGLGIFLFTTVSRTALGPTQTPIQWILGALSLGVKRPGREADHSPPSSADVKECVNIYLHSPNTFSWHGA